jgi:hypothetical protein
LNGSGIVEGFEHSDLDQELEEPGQEIEDGLEMDDNGSHNVNGSTFLVAAVNFPSSEAATAAPHIERHEQEIQDSDNLNEEPGVDIDEQDESVEQEETGDRGTWYDEVDEEEGVEQEVWGNEEEEFTDYDTWTESDDEDYDDDDHEGWHDPDAYTDLPVRTLGHLYKTCPLLQELDFT